MVPHINDCGNNLRTYIYKYVRIATSITIQFNTIFHSQPLTFKKAMMATFLSATFKAGPLTQTRDLRY